MAKPRKQHQQASKKKLQVKQNQKQAKAGSAKADAKGSSQGSEAPAASKQPSEPNAAQQHKPAETSGSDHANVYGLINLGNTCYYNSALQALVSVPALRNFYTQPQPQKGRQLEKGSIGAALQEVVQTVYGHKEAEHAHTTKGARVSRREGTPLFSPSRLRAAVIRIAPQFKGHQQQDSHELLRCLIDGLRTEENNAISYLKERTEDALVPTSFTEELFRGELSSRVVCKECSHETVTLEEFFDLSLPIPASLPAISEAGGRGKPKGKGPQKKGKASIEKPDESPAAQEQQKLTAKQRKKAEKEAHKQAQMARKKQRKRASDANDEEEALPDSTPPGLDQASPSTAAAASEPLSSSAQSSSSDFTIPEAAQQGSAEGPAAGGGQKLRGGVGSAAGSAGRAAAMSGAAQPASSRGSAQTRIPSSAPPLSETSTEVPTDSDGTAHGRADGELASSAVSPSRDSPSFPMPEEVPTTTSDTYTSRNADSISIMAAEQTGFRAGGSAAAGRGTAEGGNVREHEQASSGSVKMLSEQLRSASLAPDAKSGNWPTERSAAAAGPDSSVDALWNVLEDLDRADSTRSGERDLPALESSHPTEEQIAETDPTGELAGGTPAGKGSKPEPAAAKNCVRIAATTVVEVLLQPSAVFRATGKAQDFAHDVPEAGSKDGLIAVPVSPGPELQPRLSGSGLPEAFPAAYTPAAADERPADGEVTSKDGREQGMSAGAERLTNSVPAGEDAADVEQQLGVGLTSDEEAALYSDLEDLQEDTGVLGDVSDTEADVSDEKQERTRAADVDTSGQGTDEPEEAGEEMTELCSLFDEGEPSGSAGNEGTESWEDTADQEHVSQEATIQGCLAAFFARELITWECPPESAAASKQRSEEQALASASLDGTPQPLKRRSVSFSEEKPRIKFIPGSAEQRGTNFVRALQGDRPFCRPLKHKGGCFLLNAYVDNVTKDKLHLGLQGQDENDATQLPLRDVHAINNRIEFGSVPISPVEDPQDEEEQSRVRSQAQALLDCVADLVVHSGLQGAVALLSEGAQLQRVPSGMGSAGGVGSPHSGSDGLSRMGSETWRIVGSMPPGFGEGAWEYPPPRDDAQGLSPSFRSPSTDVYVPAYPSDKSARPGALGANPGSSQLPASFWARFAASQEPIMEAAREGSIDTDSQLSGEMNLPLTPHNSLNDDAARVQKGGGSADAAVGNDSSRRPPRAEDGGAAAGRRRAKKPPPPALETRNSFTITAEVPVSPFSNDPEGRLLSNGWEPSWPVQLPAGERDSSEAYCRIFCSDKGRKSARPLSLRSDSGASTAADSPFGRAVSGRGYIADSDEDPDCDSMCRANCQDSSSTGFGGSSPFASSKPSFLERRHSERSPFDDDAETSNSLGRRHSNRAPFTDPAEDPGDLGGMGLFTRRDSQMGFPGLDEELSNGDTPEVPSASPSLSSPFTGRSAAPSPFADPDVQLKGSGSLSQEASPAPSRSSSTSPFAAQQHSSANGDAPGQNGPAAAARWAVPNGMHGNGAANGGDPERSALGRSSADSAITPPTGVNKATGNAVFWAGSKTHGISFVDEPQDAAPKHGLARFPNGDMRLPGGAEAKESPADGDEPSQAELGANDLLADDAEASSGVVAAPAASAATGAEQGTSSVDSAQEPAAEAALAGLATSAGADDASSHGQAEGVEADVEAKGAAESDAVDSEEVGIGAERKAQSLPSPQQVPGAGGRAAAVSGRALRRTVSKSILRKSTKISVQREAVKGYLIHRAPEVLTLHLKRFQQDMRGRLAKIKGRVPFPADLDITPFCDPKGKDAAGAQYTLVGVVEQQGGMSSGHYWAYVARMPTDSAPPPPQPHPRQDSFDGDDAVPLAPAHKAGCSAKPGSGAKSAFGAKTGLSGGNAPKPAVPLTAAAAGTPTARSATGKGGSSGDAPRAEAECNPRLAGSRPKLDSARLQWFHASDEKVKPVSWDAVAACEAYLLLYVRVR